MSLWGRSLLASKGCGPWGTLLRTGKRQYHTHPQGGREGGYRELQAGLQPSPGMVMEQIIIETVSKHIKFKKGVGGSSQHGQIIPDQPHCFLWYEVLWTRKKQCILYTVALARPLTQSLIVYLSLNWWDMGSASRWWVENWLDAQTQSFDQGC